MNLTTYADNIDAASIEEAIVAARAAGYRIGKYADPTEGAREDLTDEQAIAVAREDVSLLHIRLTTEQFVAYIASMVSATGYEPVAVPGEVAAAIVSADDGGTKRPTHLGGWGEDVCERVRYARIAPQVRRGPPGVVRELSADGGDDAPPDRSPCRPQAGGVVHAAQAAPKPAAEPASKPRQSMAGIRR